LLTVICQFDVVWSVQPSLEWFKVQARDSRQNVNSVLDHFMVNFRGIKWQLYYCASFGVEFGQGHQSSRALNEAGVFDSTTSEVQWCADLLSLVACQGYSHDVFEAFDNCF
jgi:hypothetical protein